jgi:hypothetical protein
MIRFEKLDALRSFKTAELQKSACKNPLDENRAQYRVWLDEQEAAFVTFDIFWPQELNLYEVVVAKDLRRRGVCTAIIRFAANLAVEMGKFALTIRAGQIGEQTKSELIEFYKRRGLEPRSDDPDLLELKLNGPSPTDPQLQTLRLYAELISHRETLPGTLTFAYGPQSSATGLSAAVSISGGTTLLLDPDTATVKSVFRTGGLDFVVNTLDEAVRVLKNEVRKHTPLSVALTADPSTILAEMHERGIQPDLEVLIGDATTTNLALTTLRLTTADGLIQPTDHALAWLAARNWAETWLPTETTADLRNLDTRLISHLIDTPRQQWLRRISNYQRPSPNSGRAIWLNPSEKTKLLASPVE